MRKKVVITLAILLFIVFTGCTNTEKNNIKPNESNVTTDSKENDEYKETTESKEVNDSKEIKVADVQILSLDSGEFNLTEIFNNNDLEKLSLQELSLLRNSIYAKNGYKFSTEEFHNYFSKFEWYKPISKDVDKLLSQIDNENIKNIILIEEQSESWIKNSKDDKELSREMDVMVPLFGPAEKETLYITREKLDYEGGNLPTKITLNTGHNKKVFESTWNDGIYVSVVDFNENDDEIDIYITETGTDIGCTTHIYKISHGSIYPYTRFEHFGKDFLYDGKGNIYYWFNTTGKSIINTCFNYKTRESSNIWDQSIQTRLNKLFKDTEAYKENTNETNSTEKDDKRIKVAELNYYEDLDLDGNKEEINIVFKADDVDSSYRASAFIISIKKNGKKALHHEFNCYIWDYELKFISCKDKMYFYVQDEGPSDDPNATIFELCEDGINVVLRVGGYIIDYDYDGNIYTSYSYTNDKNKVLLTYYNIKDGLKHPSNDEIIGKILQYNCNMVLYKKKNIAGGHRVSSISEEHAETLKREIAASNIDTGIVKIADINESVKIVEVDYDFYERFPNMVRNIPIKVETKDGLSGWLFWLNGGD
ncbi:YARHG domain-containing protein [Oceanirhabdus sp. W0125-5]|uniref:YARHG domain-containing protein n=1 Tax=Oceanirhabdus sp. W0125-5 TaxID=2999116 RepID=UPI0022F2B2D1|nr:YARHG domain-containing protein [Oceanirhabdus sp. W0125-5]WBW99007.1 YARHG domain-containing protein [Oceanirhabdus sp. W0125-5]